jgi:predicted DNA-binding ribbon-helix-helix protein
VKERLSLRVETSRLVKLRAVAEGRKKTMTQLIEDWIDRLPNPKDDSVAEAATREP